MISKTPMQFFNILALSLWRRRSMSMLTSHFVQVQTYLKLCNAKYLSLMVI